MPCPPGRAAAAVTAAAAAAEQSPDTSGHRRLRGGTLATEEAMSVARRAQDLFVR